MTAVLIHYTRQGDLHKALTSLKVLKTCLSSIFIFNETKIGSALSGDYIKQVRFLSSEGDLGQALNRLIKNLSSSYVLFLKHTDYLSPQIQPQTIYLPSHKTVLGTYECYQDHIISQPFIVRADYLKQHSFLSSKELPFKEALLPVWMAQTDSESKLLKPNLIKQVRQNHQKNIMEKQKFIQKYQMPKTQTRAPTLSIIISNYNMEKYVATAIRSCLFQTEQANQLLMMDDGSTDQSAAFMKQFHDGSRIFFYSKSNRGKARALNDLLRYVTSDYVLELDADDFLDPNAVAVIKEQLATLTQETAVLYGNMRRWKQIEDDLLIKGIDKGRQVRDKIDFKSYRFPLGPRIYRTSYLRKEGGFPVISLKDGRLYEDISVLNQLIRKYRFKYSDFTVYNVREHKESITKTSNVNWNEFLKFLD
jgi:hypothetical protein